jgi:PIN like domain
VRLDENLSYSVANPLKALLSNRTGFEVTWVRGFNPPGTDDPIWIRGFAQEGSYAFVSGDGNILRKWPNLIGYAESSLISFFPPPDFSIS